MASPELSGSCGCGAVKFEIDAPLVGAAYCHCTRCQRRTGTAASVTALAQPGTIRVVEGEDKLRSWSPDDGWDKVFCSECGSALFGSPPSAENHAAVRLGAIDGDPGVRPAARQFVAYAAAWEPIPDDGLPRFDERLPLPGRD
jgi:hypothetical protein